jgi:hypothetical protein
VRASASPVVLRGNDEEEGTWGCPPCHDEATTVRAIARRIAALLLLGPALNANYREMISMSP